ncbi:MAG: ABC-F family ATP-binding cassette domain-containing protein [Sphingomonas sp.]
MTSFLTLDSLSLATPDGQPLAADLTLSFGPERTGIVGRNGSGKTTLLQVMAGTVEPRAGSISRSGSVALLRQHWPDERLTAAEALGVAPALARLRRLEAGIGTEQDMADADWTIEERLDRALTAVGLDAEMLARPIATLSGGERTRLAMADMILAAPDLLLLDEPTNNLDAAGRALIGDLVANWRGGVVVASHDRALLEGMDRIVELSPVGLTVVGGGWSAFRAIRDATRERAAAELDRAAGEARQVARAVHKEKEKKARRDKAGRAWRAKGADDKMFLDAEKGRAERSAGRGKELGDRLLTDAKSAEAEARERVEVLTPLRIELPASGLPSHRALVRFEAVELERSGRHILGPLSFEMRGPERVALTGPNGSGKTTVLEMLAGALAPTAGEISVRPTRTALLDQHAALLDREASVLDNLRRLNPHLSAHDAHAAAARFAFRNRAADQIVGTLSGGERLRAALACALSGDAAPELLMLDEPTNHLDIDSIEILEASLAGFDGALLVVSHDPAFLDAIGVTRTIELLARDAAPR